MGGFNENEYKKKYDRNVYKKITFRVKKDEAEQMALFIKENTSLSLNSFIKQAVDEKIENIKKHNNI